MQSRNGRHHAGVLAEKAMENAKRLSIGDFENLEFMRGPAESQRRAMVLNQVRLLG